MAHVEREGDDYVGIEPNTASLLRIHDAALTAIGRLQKLQDVYEAELIPESGQSAYALLSTSNGNVGVVGGSDQVEELIERSKPEHYVKALNAL